MPSCRGGRNLDSSSFCMFPFPHKIPPFRDHPLPGGFLFVVVVVSRSNFPTAFRYNGGLIMVLFFVVLLEDIIGIRVKSLFFASHAIRSITLTRDNPPSSLFPLGMHKGTSFLFPKFPDGPCSPAMKFRGCRGTLSQSLVSPSYRGQKLAVSDRSLSAPRLGGVFVLSACWTSHLVVKFLRDHGFLCIILSRSRSLGLKLPSDLRE